MDQDRCPQRRLTSGSLSIGSTFEGVFRKHMLVRGGQRRDSAWYSITDDEWPDARVHFEPRLARRCP